MKDWTFEYSVLLPAAPDAVYAALTDARQLKRWFAEHVDVDLKPQGNYRFWGHAFPELPKIERPKELIEDIWRMSLGNLDAYLRGGEGLVLPDFTAAAPEVRLSILIDAPRERVFQALLDPAKLNRWIAAAAVVEPRVGGRYSYGWNYEVGSRTVAGGPTGILELLPNEKLVTDWPDWRGDPHMPDTRITWLLSPVGDKKTQLTLVHSGFTRTADISDYGQGWQGFLAKLEEFMPSGAVAEI
jgi:uncharacterized protein YndB with AHSA1/START domain